MKQANLFIALFFLSSITQTGKIETIRYEFSSKSNKNFIAENIVKNNTIVKENDTSKSLTSTNSTISIKHKSLINNQTNNISISYNSTGKMVIYGAWKKQYFPSYSRNIRTNGFSGDNRRNIDHLVNYLPLSSIGVVLNTKNNEDFYGTGFLIGNGLVVTSAHVLYDFDKKIYASKASFYLGYKDSDTYTDVVNINDFYIPNEYINTGLEKFDWALIRLNNDTMVNKYGAVTISSNCSLKETKYQAIGVPNDKSEGLYYESTAYNTYLETDNIFFTYSYTYYGMSGGPVIAEYSEVNERDPNVDDIYYLIVGINQGGSQDNKYGYLSTSVKISNALITLAESLL